jgi:hypothetical protein
MFRPDFSIKKCQLSHLKPDFEHSRVLFHSVVQEIEGVCVVWRVSISSAMAERKPLTWLKASICLVESLAAKPEVTVS